jgi:hypothetical protein
MTRTSRNVRFGSKAAATVLKVGVRLTPKSCRGCGRPVRQLRAKSRQSVLQQERTLFDHLVCALQERFRDVQAECLRGPEIDH